MGCFQPGQSLRGHTEGSIVWVRFVQVHAQQSCPTGVLERSTCDVNRPIECKCHCSYRCGIFHCFFCEAGSPQYPINCHTKKSCTFQIPAPAEISISCSQVTLLIFLQSTNHVTICFYSLSFLCNCSLCSYPVIKSRHFSVTYSTSKHDLLSCKPMWSKGLKVKAGFWSWSGAWMMEPASCSFATLHCWYFSTWSHLRCIRARVRLSQTLSF